MRGWRVERRCRRVVRNVDVPQPFSVERFCEQLEWRYGRDRPRRPVYVKPLPTPAEPETPSGMWLATATSDFIFVDPQTSQHHWMRIFLHEAGHMLLGHDGLALEDNRFLYRKLAGGDPEWVRHLPRIRYTDRHELEAEVFADLLWHRILTESGATDSSGLLSGLEAATGFQRRVLRSVGD